MNTKLIKLFIFALVLVAGFSLATHVSAASEFDEDSPPLVEGSTPTPLIKGSTPAPFTGLKNPIKANSVQELLTTIADVMIFIGVIIAVLMFIWIGFKFVMARGNESELSEAKKWFLYAVVGTAVLISSKVIVEVVKDTLVSAGVVDQKQFNKQ